MARNPQRPPRKEKSEVQSEFVGGSDRESHSVSVGGIDPALFQVFRDMISASEQKQRAEIDAIEHRIESRLSKLPSTWQFLGGLVSAVVAIIAVLAFGGDRFDGGVGYGTSIGDKFSDNKLAIEENRRRDDETRENVDRILNKLDRVITRIDGDARTK